MAECCASFGCSLAQKFGEEVALPYALSQLRYFFCCKKLVNELNNELIRDLDNAAKKLRVSVEQAKRNADVVYDDVDTCLKEVERLTQEAEALARKIRGRSCKGSESKDKGEGEGEAQVTAKCKCCSLGFVPSLRSRRRIGSEAFDLAEEVKKRLTQIDKLLESDKLVSYHPYESSAATAVQNRGYEAFESRAAILNDIREALRDEKVTSIGLYGMPGIGKTVLVKEIKNELALKKNESLFTCVVFVPISQAPDLGEIQKNIAEQLGVTVSNSESVSAKAKRLKERLGQEKFLFILDDVWKKMQLDSVGIPDPNDLKDKGSKIMMTSRFGTVLGDMNATKIFHVIALQEAEAKRLFKGTAGEIVERPDFQSVADEIVQECAGLPIALETLASTLKNQPLPIWKDVLTQLQQSTLVENEVMNDKVYVSIKLTYELLRDEDAKALFLLSCLFQEDVNMSMYYTFIYAIGWGLFGNCLTLEDAIRRAFAAFNKLKAHCLLLEGDYIWSVKMHDVVRDVGMGIAANDSRMYNIKTNLELEHHLEKGMLKDSTAISLLYDGDINLPEKLECPQLRLILLWKIGYRSTPDLFFQEAKELRVLDLSYTKFDKLPPSFQVLKNLRTLSFCGSILGDITMIGELTSLEILELEKSNIVQLPEELGNLKHLRSLGLCRCSKLTSIPPNLIPKLIKLEELNMLYTPNMQWEVEGSNEGKNPSLAELRALKRLTALHIDISSTKILPKGLFSEKLERCEIVIDNGDSPCNWYGSKLSTNIMRGTKMFQLYLKDSCSIQEYDLERFMGICNEIQLFGLEGANNLVTDINTSGFPILKHLAFQENNTIQYLVDYSSQENGIHGYSSKSAFQCLETLRLWKINKLEQIIYGQISRVSFTCLREIEVKHCSNLRNLFPLSLAKNLQQLESIELKDLKLMDALVNNDGSKNDDHQTTSSLFPRLSYLSLYNLPLMVSQSNSECERINLPFFSGKVQWGISLKNVTKLYVWTCIGLKYLFSTSVAVNLPQLGLLDIQECDIMEEIIIIEAEDEKTNKIVFPKLHTLTLAYLPNLTSFCSAGISLESPLLAKSDVRECPQFTLPAALSVQASS